MLPLLPLFNRINTVLVDGKKVLTRRYFPAAPVQCSLTPGGNVPNGGCEAFLELQKALNCVGDYRLSASVNATRWAVPCGFRLSSSAENIQPEYDYTSNITKWASGRPYFFNTTIAAVAASGGNAFSGSIGSNAFAMATDLETSNGVEISGLNAEEQSDISLLLNWSGAQSPAFQIEVYSYYDAMIILRENNVISVLTLDCRTYPIILIYLWNSFIFDLIMYV